MTISEPPGQRWPEDDTAPDLNRVWAWLLFKRRSRLANRLYTLLLWSRRQNPVWLAGFILIAAGIICLYLSDQVVTGWWQGTLDAFGVGFIIGGIVDVLAITALNDRIKADEQRRQTNNRRASEFLLQTPKNPMTDRDVLVRAVHAKDLLDLSGGDLDPSLARKLWALWQYSQPPAGSPDHGDAPQEPGNG